MLSFWEKNFSPPYAFIIRTRFHTNSYLPAAVKRMAFQKRSHILRHTLYCVWSEEA